MSYDIHLVIDTGGPEPVAVGKGDHNYTYNCTPMFRTAMTGGLDSLNLKTAGSQVERLQSAIASMEAEPGMYRAMNPSNGWGSYEGALQFLRDLEADARAHPKAEFRVT